MDKKKIILITIGIAGISLLVYKLVAQKKQSATNIPLPNSNYGSPTNTQTSSGSSSSTDSSGQTASQSVIGRNAIANSSSGAANVRKSPSVGDYYVYNNIVGVINNGQSCGTIVGVSNSSDGTLWYNVQSSTSYDCPFLTCGFMITSYNNGWVKASEIKLG
jgi:hypothetical protein